MKLLLVGFAFALAICSSFLAAQTPALEGKPWARHVIDDASRGCDGVRFLDINGDGLLDCVTGWEQGGQVRACLNPGKANVRRRWPSVMVGKVGSPEDAVFVDLDGDGNIDVVSACEGKTNAVFVHWAPTPAFKGGEWLLDPLAWKTEAFPAVQGMCQWMFCEPMQIDGKGGTDLVIGGKNKNGQIGWLEAPADPRNLSAWKYHPLLQAGWVMSLVAVDMNGDTRLDILVSDRRGKASGCLWLENPGPGPEQTQPWKVHRIGPAGDEVMFLEFADLDKDGRRDVLVPTFNRKLHFFRGLAPLAPGGPPAWEQRRIAFPSSAGSGKAIRVADVNLDGKLDLVLATANAEKAHGIVWMSYRSSPLDEVWDVHDISGLEGIKFDLIQLIDLDGDGDLDVINTEESTGGKGLGVVWYENPTR
jgi:hypothetical protein